MRRSRFLPAQPEWGSPLGNAGRELFYISADNKLMAVSVKLGADGVEASPPRELFSVPAADIGWSPYDVAE